MSSLKQQKEDIRAIIYKFPRQREMLWGGRGNTIRKADIISRAIMDNMGDVIIFSDIDIKFYRPFMHVVNEMIDAYDLISQDERSPTWHPNCYFPRDIINTGFIVIRCNNVTLDAWHKVSARLSRTRRLIGDQAALYSLIRNKQIKIKWGLFDNRFATTKNGGLDRDDIIMYHMTHASTQQAKLKRLADYENGLI